MFLHYVVNVTYAKRSSLVPASCLLSPYTRCTRHKMTAHSWAGLSLTVTEASIDLVVWGWGGVR